MTAYSLGKVKIDSNKLSNNNINYVISARKKDERLKKQKQWYLFIKKIAKELGEGLEKWNKNKRQYIVDRTARGKYQILRVKGNLNTDPEFEIFMNFTTATKVKDYLNRGVIVRKK